MKFALIPFCSYGVMLVDQMPRSKMLRYQQIRLVIENDDYFFKTLFFFKVCITEVILR